MSMNFYLRDTRSNTGSNASFWAAAGGYTTNLNDAEVFTREKALRQHQCRETDLPVVGDFVVGKTRPRIDFQYLDSSPTLRDADMHVVIIKGQYDGNDVLFVGDFTPQFDLDKAKVFTLEQAIEVAQKHSNTLIYPYEELISMARITVPASELTPKACSIFAGFELVEPPKPSKEIYRCSGCGVFMSQYQYYASDCRKCGTYNRP